MSRILVDPGRLGSVPDLSGIDGILVTHTHYDHCDLDVLREAARRGVPVWAPAEDLILDRLAGVRGVVRGDHFAVGDLKVEVFGDLHAEIHPDVAGPPNRAYLIDGSTLVTGDEHPDGTPDVHVLVTPVDAPWLRATDLIRYVRAIAPDIVIGVHDGLINAAGAEVVDAVLESLRREGVTEAIRLPVGTPYVIDS